MDDRIDLTLAPFSILLAPVRSNSASGVLCSYAWHSSTVRTRFVGTTRKASSYSSVLARAVFSLGREKIEKWGTGECK